MARTSEQAPTRAGGGPELAMTAAFTSRTRLLRRLLAPRVERVAESVWLLRGGFPKKSFNVYLIEEPDGVTVFDAGCADMAAGIVSTAARLGPIKRVVLGHSHGDHRGAAPALGAPVLCHVDEAADAAGDGGAHYFRYSTLALFRPGALLFPRLVLPALVTRIWDGGPVEVAETLSEGDSVAGFEVIHLPGHAPGLIGLWRESDRLALVTDAFYTLDPETGGYGEPRIPHPCFTPDREAARASMLKLAALEPASAWPGHANPVTGDVRAQLEQAVETTF